MINLTSIRVVLVATTHAGNIGATARAMKNMGLTELVLVTPKATLPNPEALARASGADDILQSAVTLNSLEEALAGCTLTLATSARERQIPWPLVTPREAADLAINKLKQHQQVAIVFGREHAGLTNEELQQCSCHVHIPTNEAFSSLNVAAAVQVLAYELRMAYLAANTMQQLAVPTQDPHETPCSHEELENFYKHLEETLIAIKFLNPEQPKHLMARLRRLYNKAEITKLEMNILRGILTETTKSIKS